MTEPFKQHKKQAPLAIHPDDAKDKVFAAILKALIKMGNTPSSPKELANTIVKHKYATLGGQTPFATVSSRISQHFKRAAQHKPPRAPLLTKHVDQNHSRKINYSLATEDIHDTNKTISVTTKESVSSDSSSELSSEEEEVEEDDDDSTRSPIVKHARTATSTSKSTTMTMLRSSNNVDPTKQQPQDNNDDIAAAITMTKLSKQANNESDGEHSDYYEEMMLEDNTLETKNSSTTTPTQESKESITTNPTTNPTTITTSLQQQQIKKSSTPLSVVGENEYWAPFSFEQEFESAFLSAADNSIESPESISLLQFDAVKCNVNTPPPSTSPPPISSSHHRAGSLNSDTTTITNALNENDSKHSRRQSWPNDSKLASSSSKEREGKESRKKKCQVVTSTFNGHTFKITKKWIGNMEFYELDSPDDIPDTKILRFIASSNHSNTPKELKRNYVNATQLRKAATPVLGEGHFDAEEEQKQNGNVVMISEKSIAEGVWVPLHRARELVEDFEIESSPGLTKLLSDHPLDEGGETYSLPRQASSLDFSDQLTNTLMKEANSRLSDQDPNLPSKPNKEIIESLSIRNEKKQSPPIPTTATSSNTSISPSSSSSSSSTAPTSLASSNKIRKHTKIAPSTKHLSASDILKSMNIQNLNLSALQHMMAAVPNLAQGAPPPPNLNFAKILESYMNGTKAPATASVPVADASSSSSATLKQPPIQDLKNALSRIPLLDALLLNTQKQQSASYQQKILPQPSTPGMAGSSDSGTTTTASSPTSMASSTLTTASEPLVIHPTQPTEPPMSITVTDNIAVCIATLKKQEGEGEAKQEKEYQVMRRLDNGFVNGTQLLTAGGIETESERSMILSFEMSRVRMPNKKSGLFGTWIPSRRALELAATCSIQHALGPFLDDDIESLFPSPLPSAVLSAAKSRKKRSNSTASSTSGSNSNSHHLAAITLAALKNPVDHQAVSHLASKRNSTDSSSSLNILTHPNNTLKMVADSHTLQAPLLGSFLNTDGDRLVTVIDKSVASTNPMSSVGNNTTTTTAATTPFSSQNDKDNNSDVDIESEDAFMSDLVRLDDGSSASSEDENTDTDNDVEEVRKKMRKMRDAAIAAMEVESPLQLDDIFPPHDSQPPPSSSFFQQEPKRRRRSSSGAGGGSGGGGSHRKRKRKLKKRAAAVDKDNAVDSLDEEEEEDDTTDEMDAIKNHFIQSQHATPYKSFNYSRKRPAGLSGGTGGKWSASSIKMAPKAIKRSATWSGSMNTPIGSIAKRQRQQSAKAAKEVNALSLSVPATALNISTPKKDAGSQTNKTSSTILSTIKSSKKRANSLITHTVVNEEDEDEEVDIGGSDNNDDLR